MTSSAVVTGDRPPPVVVVDAVSRWFGSVVAVNDVSFELRPGITGLLGPNGAGKTTLLRLISGLAGVSQGRVRVFGEDPRESTDLYRRIGVMSEHESTYEMLTGRRLVELSARLRKVAGVAEAARRAIGVVDLADAADRPIRTYSRGTVLLIVNGKLAAEGDHHAIRAALEERPYHVHAPEARRRDHRRRAAARRRNGRRRAPRLRPRGHRRSGQGGDGGGGRDDGRGGALLRRLLVGRARDAASPWPSGSSTSSSGRACSRRS
jgi:hypothetical protein